jgi:hypothetical protein
MLSEYTVIVKIVSTTFIPIHRTVRPGMRYESSVRPRKCRDLGFASTQCEASGVRVCVEGASRVRVGGCA